MYVTPLSSNNFGISNNAVKGPVEGVSKLVLKKGENSGFAEKASKIAKEVEQKYTEYYFNKASQYFWCEHNEELNKLISENLT